MDKRELLLVIFPLLQGASFAAVCFLISNAAAAATTVILAALFLSFSLHITYHYHVHFKRRSALANRLIDLAITVLAGLPFHYYQMLHWNHHKYDNALGDFASTWKDVGGRPVARNLLPYALLWPFRRDLGLREQVAIASREGYFKPVQRRYLVTECVVLLGVYAALAFSNVWLVLAYLSMVYIGWALIAMHNYGQHLPDVYGGTKGHSYYGRLYNLLTVYNGLHYEHHHRPSVKYWHLRTPVAHAEIEHPHLLAGVHFLLKRRRSQPRPRP